MNVRAAIEKAQTMGRGQPGLQHAPHRREHARLFPPPSITRRSSLLPESAERVPSSCSASARLRHSPVRQRRRGERWERPWRAGSRGKAGACALPCTSWRSRVSGARVPDSPAPGREASSPGGARGGRRGTEPRNRHRESLLDPAVEPCVRTGRLENPSQPPCATDGKTECRGGKVLLQVTPSEHRTPVVPC